jgi:hypothetical protein
MRKRGGPVMRINDKVKLQMYEAARKIIVELLVEVISGVISKLFFGGAPGRHTLERAAETPA